jgi:hypothetical protein
MEALMKVGMIQSNYIPWRGYFDFIDSVDTFILYDDVLYGTGRKWRNRNRIKTPTGIKWLTVPIHRKDGSLPIYRVPISYQADWISSHCRQLFGNYRHAKFFHRYYDRYCSILAMRHLYISQLNEALIRWIASELDIHTNIRCVTELDYPPGPKETRPLDILKQLGATSYLTGPNTLEYTESNCFKDLGIRLQIKSYSYPVYTQLWSEYAEQVTILDLLFNVGPASRHFLKSLVPDKDI